MTDLFNETRYADEVYDKLLFTDSRLSGKEFQDCTFLACDFSNSSLLDCNLGLLIKSQSGTQFHLWPEWINVYISHFHQFR